MDLRSNTCVEDLKYGGWGGGADELIKARNHRLQLKEQLFFFLKVTFSFKYSIGLVAVKKAQCVLL